MLLFFFLLLLHHSVRSSSEATTAAAGPKPLNELVAAAVRAEELAGDAMLTLGESNFTAHTNNDDLLLLFYAPWCAHSATFRPTFAKLSRWARRNKAANWPALRTAKVDCIDAPSICAVYQIRGYPTVLAQDAADGTRHVHDGRRELAPLQQWLTQLPHSPASKAARAQKRRKKKKKKTTKKQQPKTEL